MILANEGRQIATEQGTSTRDGDRDRGERGAGVGHVPPPPHQYFQNYKELLQKSVLYLPNIESLTVPPPNLKVAPRSLREHQRQRYKTRLSYRIQSLHVGMQPSGHYCTEISITEFAAKHMKFSQYVSVHCSVKSL